MAVLRHQGPLTVKRVNLIEVAAFRGSGTKQDPTRVARWYYDDSGELVACNDSILDRPDAPPIQIVQGDKKRKPIRR